MKLFYTLSFTLISLLMGCKKPELKSAYHELEGEYQWTHTILGIQYSHSPEHDTCNYGIRIQKNGNIQIYVNDYLSYSGVIRIESTNPITFSVYSNRYQKNKHKYPKYENFKLEENQLLTNEYPFKSSVNYFKKNN